MKQFKYAFLATALLASFTNMAGAEATSESEFSQYLQTELQSQSRPAADKAQDAQRQPVKMVEFLGISRGDTVLDAGAGGGYATEVFSAAVGHSGHVIAQNDSFAMKLMDGKYVAPLIARTEGGRLPNAEMQVWEMTEIPLDSSVDVAFWGNNLHDYYNRDPKLGQSIINTLFKALKPGGTLGLTDHIGVAGQNNGELHRLDPSVLTPMLEKAGFTNIESSSLYHNASDSHAKSVFDSSIRGNTDKLFIKAMKPE